MKARGEAGRSGYLCLGIIPHRVVPPAVHAWGGWHVPGGRFHCGVLVNVKLFFKLCCSGVGFHSAGATCLTWDNLRLRVRRVGAVVSKGGVCVLFS